MKEDTSTFGQRLKRLREAFGISQQKLAEMIGLKQYSVAKWEGGAYQPAKEISDKIAAYFLVSPGWLHGKRAGQSVFTGTIVTHAVDDGYGFGILSGLVAYDGFSRAGVLCENEEGDGNKIVVFNRNREGNVSTVLIPTRLDISEIEQILSENTVRSPDEKAIARFVFPKGSLELMYDPNLTRKRLEDLFKIPVTQDNGEFLRPQDRMPGLHENRIRAAFDLFVQLDITQEDINEAVRRYRLTNAPRSQSRQHAADEEGPEGHSPGN